MTVAPHGPRLAPQTLQEAIGLLRERGIRVTAARRLVLEGLFAAHEPVTAEHLAGGLGGAVAPSDLASTYRNLEALERLGMVHHVHLGHGPGLYQRAGAPEREYLVCERCGAIRSVDAGELDTVRGQIREAFGFEASFSHFPIAGLCAGCAHTDPN